MILEVNAFHVEKKIDLDAIQQIINYPVIKEETSFSLYRIKKESLVYLKDFGAIVFINVPEKIQKEFFKALNVPLLQLDGLENENFTIEIKPDSEITVDFDTVILPDFDEDLGHIIMLNMAQSVALSYYANQSYALIEENKYYLNQLEELGRVKLRSKEMKKFIGKTMNLRLKIAENLYIFETPELAWNDEAVSQLDIQLKKELDIKDRHFDLQNNLTTTKETLDVFKDLIQHNHSSLLEWIIILLILFEVIQVIIEKLIF